ncbi:hypothetical protein JHE03_08270 [Pluralibacter gergoviae]|uniref:hypothetical protein n=1 Tax=Pluralibacter gergoviae TaxID=61647 RepID=UPI0019098639|nr:hypothetical protein [Pluralibacter gergoviae]ELC3076222.1 hypothetical protein [Pluralibacter gergoviae]MBK4116292.1 hypothetical protein [Pluralibacter gergoviae]
MKTTVELKLFQDDRQISSLETTSITEYKRHLREENLLFVDPHGHLVDSFSGRQFAVSKEQINELIAFLEDIRDELPDHDSRYL